MVVNVIMEAVRIFKLTRDTLHLAVNMFDRILVDQKLKQEVFYREHFMITAIVCLHIASKKVSSNSTILVSHFHFHT